MGTCKSFSYMKSRKMCIVSSNSLSYDPEFTLHTKRQDGGKNTKKKLWRSFPGLTLKSSGWLKSRDKSKKECAALCKKAKTCKAWSYRRRDRLCLVSGGGLEYSPGFTYYEKNPKSF